MSADFTSWAAAVRRLVAALAALERRAASLGVAVAEAEEWRQLLLHKLAPQAETQSPVVAAVVGGTNIGKSAVFNQLAGADASAVSPLAAGTKHPVCLAPPSWADHVRLASLFAGFDLAEWSAAADALRDDPRDLLFWRVGEGLPDRLLLLDTPDIDSDAKVNWRRADVVRQSADVLVGVLTQQKYNDAAVKQFFRQAAAADKGVIVVFNQVDLQHDRDVWPEWLAVFCRETGVRPLAAFAVPYDRQAAQTRGLRFFSVGPDGRAFDPSPVDLRRELAELRYDELKTRTFGGALRQVLDPDSGLDRYLREVRAASGRFAAARRALTEAHRIGAAWPALPASVLVEEIRRWWDERRGPWARKIHGFYRSLGQAVLQPVRRLTYGASPPPEPPAAYAERERAVVVEGVGRLIDELDRLARVGNDVLKPRLERLLGGAGRAEHLARILDGYRNLPPVDDDFRRQIGGELDELERRNPRATAALRSLDTAAAFARPVVSVSLAVTGVLLPAGDVFGPMFVGAASHAVQEAAAAAVVAGGGEAAVGAAGAGLKNAAALMFRRLQTDHAARRAQQLTDLFAGELLGPLLAELDAGAHIGDGRELAAVDAAAHELRRLLPAATEAALRSE